MKKQYSKLSLAIRSTIFFLYSTLSIALYSLLLCIAVIFPLRFRHWLIRCYLRAYFFVLDKVCHLNYKVEGLEHLKNIKSGIVLSKHQSTWETFFLPIFFHDPTVIVKKELLYVPFFGWGLAASVPIAINRQNKSSAMQQVIRKGRQCLEKGRWVIIFPEGTRVPFGTVGHYRLGGARLASATGYPVIPVAHNAGYFWPRRTFIKRPGTVTCVIGPPIDTTAKSPEEILQLTKDWIETTMTKINGLVDKSTD